MAERLPAQRPDELTAAQRVVYRAITQGRRSAGPRLFETTGPDGRLLGPFAAMVAAPAVGGPLQRLGEALRYESSLPDVARETAILTVAAHHRAEYEWYAHAAVARHLGVPDDVLAALRDRAEPPGVDPTTLAVWRFASVLLARGEVPEAEVSEVTARLGLAGVVELVTLVGYYVVLAQLLDVVGSGLPEGVEPAF